MHFPTSHARVAHINEKCCTAYHKQHKTDCKRCGCCLDAPDLLLKPNCVADWLALYSLEHHSHPHKNDGGAHHDEQSKDHERVLQHAKISEHCTADHKYRYCHVPKQTFDLAPVGLQPGSLNEREGCLNPCNPQLVAPYTQRKETNGIKNWMRQAIGNGVGIDSKCRYEVQRYQNQTRNLVKQKKDHWCSKTSAKATSPSSRRSLIPSNKA
mmetsp:Transcript_37018/g.64273  ORF Transcript_37018/g.64273 Transcript_37018/m.64273 type:complete len:211 (+) Transcript_37018:705-1337(+)